MIVAAVGLAAAQDDVAAQIRSAQASGDYARAAKLYAQLIESGEDTPELRSNCGIMLHLAGKNAEALTQFRSALARKPDLVAANLFAGEAEFDLGRPRAAIPLLEKARALAPGDPAPLMALAKTELALRDFFAANQSYRTAAELDPKLAEAWYGAGITYRSMADQQFNRALRAGKPEPENARKLLDQALAALKRAVELDPNSARSHLILAESARDSGHLTEAVREYRSALELDPHMQAAYLGLATAYWKERQFENALPPLRHVLASSPKDPEANGMMADMLEHDGDYERARRYAETALAGNPDLIETHVVLARIDLATSHPERAVEDLESVLGADRDGGYHYLLYRAYKQLGKEQEAAAALKVFRERRKMDDGTEAPR